MERRIFLELREEVERRFRVEFQKVDGCRRWVRGVELWRIVGRSFRGWIGSFISGFAESSPW